MSTGTDAGERRHIPTSTSSTQPIVQDQSAYVYHEIKPHMEPYLSTIIEEEPVKMAPIYTQKEVLAQVPLPILAQPKQQHKKKKHRK
jgi:hypothetical protein